MSSRADHQDIRLGTLVRCNQSGVGKYIKQILPYGFECFQLFFWGSLGGVDLTRLADEVKEALGDSGAIVSSIGMFGNPMDYQPQDVQALRDWQLCIDHASLFECDIVAGFTGRLRGQSIEECMPRFKAVWGELARRAADRGVRIAFENCPMGGDWKTGDWNIAHNPAAWRMMFDTVPAENLGLEWEPCHQMTQLIDPLPQLKQWVPKIFHLHGKCATIKWDVIREYGIGGPKEYVYHRTPGFGDCNWTDIISDLRMQGFRGCIDIEGWHDPVYRDDLEVTGQVRGLNYLKQCRGGPYVPNPA